jgi:poly [ADP-ribose] polymerase 2/3/4
MAAIVREARFILSDVECNSNKFWHIALYDDHTCVTHWGRVGEGGAQKEFPFSSRPEAESFFTRKQREKEGKGYCPQRTLESGVGVQSMRLAQLALEQIQTDCPETQRLIAKLSRANVHNILSQTSLQYDSSTGTFSTPLGIITKDAIIEARALLGEIATYVHTDRYQDAGLISALNQYLMLVPQDLGRAKPDPHKLFPGLEAVQAQNALLDNLDASLEVALSKKADAAPAERLFDAKLTAVEDGIVIDRIRRKFLQTWQARHACAHLQVSRVYAVEVGAMRQAFERKGRKVGNVQELWHGTRVGNLLSILKSGFVIPPADAPHVTGRMFGNGVYFSDQSTKSLNYAYGYWGGGGHHNQCYMFLCDVAMGRVFKPKSFPATKPRFMYDSLFAEGGKVGLLNNEMVVYDTAQVNPTYLVEFGPKDN